MLGVMRLNRVTLYHTDIARTTYTTTLAAVCPYVRSWNPAKRTRQPGEIFNCHTLRPSADSNRCHVYLQSSDLLVLYQRVSSVYLQFY